MTEHDLEQTFADVIVGEFGVPDDDYALDATFESMGLDSLDLVELTLVVEEEVGVRIEDEELEDVRTPADAIEKIRAKATV